MRQTRKTAIWDAAIMFECRSIRRGAKCRVSCLRLHARRCQRSASCACMMFSLVMISRWNVETAERPRRALLGLRPCTPLKKGHGGHHPFITVNMIKQHTQGAAAGPGVAPCTSAGIDCDFRFEIDAPKHRRAPGAPTRKKRGRRGTRDSKRKSWTAVGSSVRLWMSWDRL